MLACKLTLIFWFLLLSLQLSALFSRKEDSENSGIVMTIHHMRSEEAFVTGEAGFNNDDQAFQQVAQMVQASKDRASALKHRGMSITGEGSLYAHPFSYYIKLRVGTPPQDVFVLMDTGSNVVWLPCTTTTRHYKCYEDCPENVTSVFLPRKSSSAVAVQCADPKCKDLCQTEHCVGGIKNCSRVCPDYKLRYGKGNATGSLLSETLTLPLEDGGTREIKHFGVGCSVLSFNLAGIAGFGRGGLSMSSQLSPIFGDRFAYCLHSYHEGTKKNSRMVLGNKAVPKNIPLKYIPFLNNSRNPTYITYYYIGLTGISIGGKRLKLPSKFLTFDSKGNGGTIIDSGTSFTLYPPAIYKIIVDEFDSQILYTRARDLEDDSGSGLCYIVNGTVKNIQFPEFAFHFNHAGGSDMVLPFENTFFPNSDIYCLAMLSTSGVLEGEVGPAVLLGNYQQQNFYILYDREKNRLGFAPKTCETFP